MRNFIKKRYHFPSTEIYEVPISQLTAPPEHLLVRKVNQDFVNTLVKEIQERPLAFFDPLLCLVEDCADASVFEDTAISSHKFATLGGNHRRTAIQSLVEVGFDIGRKSIPCQLVFGKTIKKLSR